MRPKAQVRAFETEEEAQKKAEEEEEGDEEEAQKEEPVETKWLLSRAQASLDRKSAHTQQHELTAQTREKGR